MVWGGKGLATVLAVVVVLSMVAPTTVAAGTPDRSVRAATGVDADQARANPGDAPGGVAQIAGNGSSLVGEDALPVVRKLAAIRAVRNISTNGNGGLANHVSRAESRFNGTLSAYSDARRLRESGAFTDDAVGIRALAHFNGTNQSQRAKQAADIVFEADNESARTAVVDARRVLNRFGDSMENPGQRRSAQSHLQTAERALDRAERARSRSTDGRKYWGARAQALTQLRTAHRHAHMVLRFVDREAGARIEITSTDDPIRNGSQRTRYVVSGTVTAPRPATLGNVTVSVVGGSTVTAQTGPGTVAPGENISFVAPVNLTDRVNEIEVSVERDGDTSDSGGAPGRNGRGNGKARGNNGNDRGNGPPSSGAGGEATATFRLDGDGLSEAIETSTLGTDPLDPDSDASATATDEAGDGVIDGREDFDGDNLTTLRELELGTDPLSADSDGDELADGEELVFTGTDPLAADSDGDGTDDGAEDPDGDGLTNVEEVEAGTFTDLADSDGDGLDDPAELDAGTDPLAYDTDDDGLQDGDELRKAFGTDPLDEDTDDDGVLDGNETYATVASDNETGVTVSVTGEGNVAEEIRLRGVPQTSNVSARVGPVVRVDNETAFDEATVTIPIEEGVNPTQRNLSVYTWNGSASDRWHAIETTIDDGTAVATVESFSYFTVLDTDEWVSATTVPAADGNGTLEPISFPDQAEFDCSQACGLQNDTTLLLGGEPTARKIVVKQGNRTIEVVPLSNGQTIEQFYDFGEAEINSPLPVAKSDVSRLFFWSGPNGLSLVVLHDKDDQVGGAVTLSFDSLPNSAGNWVVRDDDPGNDRWRSQQVDWRWQGENTDGGAFRGGLRNSSIAITPAFNENAYFGNSRPNEISGWEVVTGLATDPQNHSLAMDEPATVHIPSAAPNGTDIAGDTGTATFDYQVPDGQDTLSVVYQTEQTDVDPNASVVVTGASGGNVTEHLNIGTVGTVEERLDLSGLADGTVNVEIAAEGVNLRAQLAARSGNTSGVDSDGDGLLDRHENRTWLMPKGPVDRFSTDPFDADTDDDGLEDGEEVSFERSGGVVTVDATSNPAKADTDGDGLEDDTEVEGWTETVVNTTGGEPYRYHDDTLSDPPVDGMTVGEVRFDSSPLERNSDDDGLDDAQERYATHTDPEQSVTYEITHEHEEMLKDVFGGPTTIGESTLIREMGLYRNDIEFRIGNPTLTDATDDFDMVTDDEATGLDRFAILTLDGSDRTDYWLGNEHEMTDINSSPIRGSPGYLFFSTDPWVSDTDGDGLTDGQEFNGLGVIADGSRIVYTTEPTLRDTDSDRLEDLAELRFGSDPRAKNIDGDQFSDFTDPAPYTENIPPTPHASFKQGALLGEIVWVGASDDSGVEEVRAIYEYETAAGGTEDAIYVFHPDGATTFEERASPPAGVANLTIQASDVRGNAYGVTIRIGGDGTGQALSSDVALAAGGVFGSAATNPIDELALSAGGGVSLGTAAVGLGVGIVVVGGVLGVVHVYDVATTEATTETYEVPLFATPAVASYQNGDIHLREGFVRTSGEFTRGYGWAYIQATSTFSQDEINRVIQDGNRIGPENGEGYIIGSVGGDDVVIKTVGGMIVAIYLGTIIEDPLGDKVEIDRTDEHPVRDDGEHPNWDEIEETVKNPDEVWQSGRNRLYVKYINGRWLVVRAYFSGVVWTISTAAYEGNTYDAVEDLLDQFNYGPGDKIYPAD